jgi:hypothetical protein
MECLFPRHFPLGITGTVLEVSKRLRKCNMGKIYFLWFGHQPVVLWGGDTTFKVGTKWEEVRSLGACPGRE